MDDPKNQPIAYSQEAVFSNFMQRVYQWMTMGLALTGLISFLTLQSIGLLKFLVHGGLWVFFVAELVIVFWLSASIRKISASAAALGFFVYATLNGITISTLLLVYTAASVSLTFFITAMTFAGVSLYGWATKQDLTSIGSFCFMALIGLIIATIANMFFHSTMANLILSYIGVALFIGLTAYDTQRLKVIHQNMANPAEQLAIFGALMLYLDFINMFLWLLQIFGRRR